MTAARKKRPRDPNQLAKLVADIATGEVDDAGEEKNLAAQSLGKKGGRARADALSAERRAEIARKAAKSRWRKE